MLNTVAIQAADGIICAIWSHIATLMYEKQILHSKTLCKCPLGSQIDYQSRLHLYLNIHLNTQNLRS